MGMWSPFDEPEDAERYAVIMGRREAAEIAVRELLRELFYREEREMAWAPKGRVSDERLEDITERVINQAVFGR